MMTERQQRVYEFIKSRISATGRAPSYDEICAHLQIASKSNVHGIILSLEERGLISRLPNKARAIALGKDAFARKPEDQDTRHALLMIRDAVNLHKNIKISAAEALRRIERYAWGQV